VSKSYRTLVIISRNFIGAIEDCLLNPYKTMVRTSTWDQVWHPRRLQDVDKLESGQKKVTKIIS